MNNDPFLQLEDVSMKYFSNVALSHINLTVEEGTIRAVIGSNGAGKSTLVKIIAGQIHDYTGRILIDGKPVRLTSVSCAKKHGIYISPQDIVFFDNLSVEENLYLGTFLDRCPLRRHVIRSECKKALERVGLDISLSRKGSKLSLAEKFLIQFARILLDRPRLIILDELTDSLTLAEASHVYSILRRLKDEGTAIIYITHRIDEAADLADIITTMRDGEIVSTATSTAANKQELTENMLGEDIKTHYPKLFVSRKEPLLQARHISTHFLNNISFELYRGEILGIAGLVGSGRSSLLRAIVGMDKLKYGEIEFFNEKPGQKPAIGFLPENRDTDGIFFNLPISQNITIRNLPKISRFRLIRGNMEHLESMDIIDRFGIDTPDGSTRISHLSGGNKQKTIVGRNVFSNSSIFVFDEPTKGIDIAGKVEIYNILNELIRKGAGILFVSSDFSELSGMCDRLLVIKKGSLVGEFSYSETTQEQLFSLCGP